MFTNPFLRWFFNRGQVLDTERGAGIFQPAVDEAVKIVQDGGWVRLTVSVYEVQTLISLADAHFPRGQGESSQNQPQGGVDQVQVGSVSGYVYPRSLDKLTVPSSGRIIMDSAVMPEIIPMWISGQRSLSISTPKWLKIS